MKKNRLTTWIITGMVLGLITGYICHRYAADAAQAKTIAGYFSIVTDIFLRLIKMIIAPLVFTTLVAGMAHSEPGSIGRVGLKAMSWFITASLISLAIGLLFSNLFEPGRSLALALPDVNASTKLATGSLNLKDFLTHVFPRSFFEAMGNNEILQILVFSIFFGFALSSLKGNGPRVLVSAIEETANTMLKITDYVMRFAPIGVFAAVAAAITVQGLEVVLTYGKFLGSFFLALALLWVILIAVGFLFLGREVFRLMGLIKEPMIIAFSTASSEASYPKTIEQLEKFGVSSKITGFVLPLGYSFNLDGSMVYQAFAVMFIAQAYGIEMSLSQQITILLVLMVSSKGMAGVSRASLVVVAAVLPMFNLPEAGLLLIMGVDQFLDMGRTATNVLGNSIATSVVAKWEEGKEPVASGVPANEAYEEHEPVLARAANS
ncbi:membrane attached sodium:dicarboxylate symporter family protein [Undibacterium sp. KW1]|uniref:dicarboxylate/amino acid:cation symporter n=1 Tax=Undibacterium sp. KW1 TaxID=2058624 RepID=UPI001331E315|nr:dicarboxylate/amino acid:cation symporter [Undibacterium sp. KW1]BBB62572.1 membrane attached sodium:dicarboxylate symporter family protein [Undibacterium sp. KW1]